MKKITVIFASILLLAWLFSPAQAMQATTADDAVACFTKESIDDMISFVAAQDRASFQAYINTKKCIILRGGQVVTVVDSPGMFGGTAGFVLRGIKLWTVRHGLTNYR
jgi:hypothetical protein